MTDDIVTRLRNHVRGDYEKTAEFLLGLAADEIERLRAERDTAVKWRDNYKLAFERSEKNAKYWHQKATGVGQKSTENGTDLTDIVTLLREPCSWVESTHTRFQLDQERAKAADEIERLQAEVESYKATVRAWEHKWENRKWWKRG